MSRFYFNNKQVFFLSFLCLSFSFIIGKHSSYFSKEPKNKNLIYPTIIIGGGIGGLSASIFLAKSGIKTIVIEGSRPGGLLTLSDSVRNWPTVQNSSGQAIVDKIKKHALFLGVEFIEENATTIKPDGALYKVSTQNKIFLGKFIILATGTTPNKLGVAGEDSFWGKGISNCAICDGALYKGKVVAVVGGGQSAVEEALYLSSIAKTVHLIVRKPSLKSHDASKLSALNSKKNVQIWQNSIITEIDGDQTSLKSIQVLNTKTKATKKLEINGLFEAIGASPNNKLVANFVDYDKQGFIKTNKYGQTSRQNIFAIGDVTQTKYRQAIIVAQQAAVAAFRIQKELSGAKLPVADETKAIHPAATKDLKDVAADYAVIIVGNNAGTYTAATYLQQAGYNTLILEKKSPQINQNPIIWPGERESSRKNLREVLKRDALFAGATIEEFESIMPSLTSQSHTVIINSNKKFSAAVEILWGPEADKSSDENTKIITNENYHIAKDALYMISRSDSYASEYSEVYEAGRGAFVALEVCEFLQNSGYAPSTLTTQKIGFTPEISKIAPQKQAELPHVRTVAEFKKLKEQHENILIDCFAEWCPPCRRLKPIIKKIYDENKYPEVFICGVDVSESEALSDFLGIQNLPTIISIKNGREIDRALGFKTEEEMHLMIKKNFLKP
jgi:thioredoxin reductase (NADPH)